MKSSQNVHNVTSLDLPALQPYRTLRRPLEHMKEGIFIAEGEKVVRRLLESDLDVVSLLLTEEWYTQLFLTGDLNPPSWSPKPPVIFVAHKKLLETIVGYNLHQGIMAVGKVPHRHSMEKTLESVSRPYLLVALDDLVNAENVGVIVRNCAAFGVGAIIVGETSSSPYLRRAVRNSMGTVFQVPVVHTRNLAESLQNLRQKLNVNTIAAHPHDGSPIQMADFTRNICIVLGHEGMGISEGILKVCSSRVAIPMMNGTDSLNVASASAVFLYEVWKQRTNLAKVSAKKTADK